MPAQDVVIKQLSGLFVQANSFSGAVPDGAFEEAENVVFTLDGLCKKRRGLSQHTSTTFTDPTAITEFSGTRIVALHKELYRLSSSGTPTQYTDASSLFNIATDGSKPRFQTANGNLFITSTNGVLKLESTTANILPAGIPRALDLQLATTGASGFLANNFDTSYRIVFGRKDVNNNNILGAPSEYTTVINTSGGSRDVSLTFSLPSGLVADEHYYQIYRTAQVATGTGTDENTLQLIYEKKISSAEITAGFVTFTDSTDDVFRDGGAYLYTNPNQESVLQANTQPPRCEDLALFKEMMFYANTETKHTLSLNLISVTNLLNNSVTFTFSGGTEVYTGKATENIGNKEFQVFSGGTLSQNIDQTAKSFCKIINRQSAGKLYALYLSSVEDIPGKMFIFGRNFSEPFTVTVNTSTITNHFQPELPTSGTTVASTNDDLKNAVYVSKRGIPEAVPLTNFYRVGSQSDAILRIIPLRDSVIVISEGGVFSMRGESPTGIVVTPIDTTAICKAKHSVTLLNNTVYMLSTQGIVGVTDTSVQVISRNIEPLFTSIVGSTYVDMLTVATGYESDRLLLISTLEPNARLTAVTIGVATASLTSNIVTLVYDESVEDQISAGDVIVNSGFSGGFAPLNGTFFVQSVSGANVTFRLVNANIASASVSGETTSVIGASVVYCYNTVTQAWSTWDETTCFKSAVVSPSDDKLYVIDKDSYVLKERKEATKLDYTERSYSATVQNVDSDAMTSEITISGYTPRIGDAVVKGNTINKITAIDLDVTPNVYTYDSTPGFASSDSVTVYAQFDSTILTAPLTLGDAARAKRFLECSLFFRTRSATKLSISFKTNLIIESQIAEWETDIPVDGWGFSPWGLFPWGLPGGIDVVYVTEKNQHARVYVPREAQRANYIQVKAIHSVASEVFDLQSISFLTYAYSTDSTR